MQKQKINQWNRKEEPVIQPSIQHENYDKGGVSNKLKKLIIQLILRTMGSPLRERRNTQ